MDRAPINFGGIDIVFVDESQYFRSPIHHCRPSNNVVARIAAASSACGHSKSLYFPSVILTFTLNGVCSTLAPYLYQFMVWNAGPRCSVIFAICLPFTCVVFVLFWGLLGHKLGWSASLMLSCLFCG